MKRHTYSVAREASGDLPQLKRSGLDSYTRMLMRMVGRFSKPALVQYIATRERAWPWHIDHGLLQAIALSQALRTQHALTLRMRRLLARLEKAKAIERKNGWLHFVGVIGRRRLAARRDWIQFESLSRSYERNEQQIRAWTPVVEDRLVKLKATCDVSGVPGEASVDQANSNESGKGES